MQRRKGLAVDNRTVIGGLDIGSTKVNCVIAERDQYGQLAVIGFGRAPCTGVRRGVVVDIDGTARAIQQAAMRASQQAGMDMPPVWVGITGEHVKSLNSKGVTAVKRPDHEITDEDRARALDQAKLIVIPPDREIVHAIPRHYTIDGEHDIVRPVGMSGSRLEVETHIVTALKTALMNVDKSVDRAGLSLDGKVLASLVTSEAVVNDAQKQLGVCVVDIGGSATDIAIFARGQISFSSFVPVGGGHVTSDIAQILRLPLEEAERVKSAHGGVDIANIDMSESVPVLQIGRTEPRRLRRGAVYEIVRARVVELFELIRKDINRGGGKDAIPAGVVLTGGGSLLVGCEAVAAEVLDLPVQLGANKGLLGLGDSVSAPSEATVLGLAIYGDRMMEMEEEEDAGARNHMGKIGSLFRRVFRS